MIFLFAFVLFCATSVEWQTPVEHNFGAVSLDKPVRHSFVFKNIGGEPIVLETVRTSCGCTAAEWPETPIEPGATGAVAIDFEGYIKGPFRKKIRVFFDKQKAPEILWISGEVR